MWPITATAAAAILLFSIMPILTPKADANTTVISTHTSRTDALSIPSGSTFIIEASGALDAKGLVTNNGKLVVRGTLDISGLDNHGDILVSSKGVVGGGSITNIQGATITIEDGAALNATQFHNQGTVNNRGAIASRAWYAECGGMLNDFGTFGGKAPIESCKAASPVVVMSDTTAGNPSLVYAGRPVNAELAGAGSSLVGKKIDSIALRLARVGQPAGTFQAGIFGEDRSAKKVFTAGNVASLPGSMQDVEFKLPNSEPLYAIQAGDRIGIRYGGDAENGVNVAVDRTVDATFDGTASHRTRYESGWLVDTGEDLYMILKQTRS